MNENKPKREDLPDFVQMKRRFDETLTNGQRADIRRVRSCEDLEMIPAYYRLLLPDHRPNRQWQRIVMMLPCAGHAAGADPIGSKLARGGVSEARLFQMLRSEDPQDLLHLRRLCQQVQPVVDWKDFGSTLFFWGKRSKQRILEDFYLYDTKGTTD